MVVATVAAQRFQAGQDLLSGIFVSIIGMPRQLIDGSAPIRARPTPPLGRAFREITRLGANQQLHRARQASLPFLLTHHRDAPEILPMPETTLTVCLPLARRPTLDIPHLPENTDLHLMTDFP